MKRILFVPILAAAAAQLTAGEPSKNPAVGPGQFGPTVVVHSDEKRDRLRLRLEAERMLEARDYDKLDLRAREVYKTGTNYPSGFHQIASFYLGVATLQEHKSSSEDYENRIAKLTEWAKQKPDSLMAGVCLARCWYDYALFARGSGFSHTVSDKQWKVFRERLAISRAALDSVKSKRAELPIWHANALRLARAQELSEDESLIVFKEAIKTFPDYEDFYFQRAYHLTPKWSNGDVRKFIEESAGRRTGVEADAFYARIVWSLRTSGAYSLIYRQTDVSWPRVKNGFNHLMKRYPHNIQVATEFCYEAIQAEDHAQARKLFEEEVRNKAILEVWDTRFRFAVLRDRLYKK